MSHVVETARGTVHRWQCDHMGHVNVRAYGERFEEACWQYYAMIGILPSRLRRWMLGSLLLPLVLPEIAFGLAYLVCYRTAGIPLGWTTLLLSHFAFTFCYVVLVLKNGVARLDPSLADAARDLGAGPFTVFRHAILPQLVPSLVAGAMMAFSLSLDDFLISFFVKGVDQLTLPVKVFSMMRLGIGPEIYALSVVLFGFSFLSVIITQVWLYRSQKSRR